MKHHTLYDEFIAEWILLRHVREGTGGLRSGEAIVAHPREWLDHSTQVQERDPVTGEIRTVTRQNPNPVKPSAKLSARRRLANYTNYAAAILEAYKGPLFREAPTRRVESKGEGKAPTLIEQWWENVDGKGTPMTAAMQQWWDLAATFGHVVLYFEIPDAQAPPEGTVVTAADQPLPYICWYIPEDVPDWLQDDRGNVTAIKVQEALPPTSFATSAQPEYQVRVIDDQGWTLYKQKTGAWMDEGEHGLGRVPFVYLFSQRRPVWTAIGKSILGDPKAHIDVYNQESELRELQRGQTFTMINVQLGTGPDAPSVNDAQNMMGTQSGTMAVIMTPGPASVLSGESQNLSEYRECIAAKVRAIYRESGVQFETDTKDAEAEGSLSLKREHMNTNLSTLASECELTERAFTDLFYRWQYGAEAGPRRLTDDGVTVHYPERFEQKPFAELIEQIEAAQRVGMPPSVLKELRKAILVKFEGMSALPAGRLKELLDEIEAMPDDPTPQERLRQKMDIVTAALKTGQKPPVVAKDDKAA